MGIEGGKGVAESRQVDSEMAVLDAQKELKERKEKDTKITDLQCVDNTGAEGPRESPSRSKVRRPSVSCELSKIL